MSQTTSNMESCNLFLFGDQTISFELSLRQLVHVKGNGLLNVFFERIAFTLRETIAALPAHQQELFPRFTTIVDLVHDVGTTKGAPALKFPLLCLYEIGQFIKYVFYLSARSQAHNSCQVSWRGIKTISNSSEQLPSWTLCGWICRCCYLHISNSL